MSDNILGGNAGGSAASPAELSRCGDTLAPGVTREPRPPDRA
ncbi:MAG: hypothetical protein ACRD2E_10890 [Terriglobales bacterium]